MRNDDAFVLSYMREETINNCFATVMSSECTNILIDLRQCMLLTQVEKSLYLRRNIINARVLMQFCLEAFLIDQCAHTTQFSNAMLVASVSNYCTSYSYSYWH